MGADENAKAPTLTIETVLVVRPLKVVALMLGCLAILLLILSVGATAWLQAGGTREGLWARCDINHTSNTLECHPGYERAWITTCQALCLTSMVVCIVAILVTTFGMRTDNFKIKYKLYMAGLCIFFIAVAFELISLVTFPIKFLGEAHEREETSWNFGWAYVIGWCGALCEFAAGLFILIDRGAEEILYRERVVQEEDCNGIEGEDV